MVPVTQKRFSTRLQTRENVRKCHFCHAKQHYNQLWCPRKGQVSQEHFVRDFLRFSHFVAAKLPFSCEFSHEPQNLRPQNRCFVRGYLTKFHACHGICTLSPLHAALTMRFAKSTPHDMSKVLRLPRDITIEVAKVLCLPRKLEHIFWKRSKSLTPATQNDFWHVMQHVGSTGGVCPEF